MIQVSPGINVSEFDNTTTVPAVSTTVGAIAGVFKWGPGYQKVLVDSENTLVSTFGKPDNDTYESFLTAANFLSYGNALYVVRTYSTNAYNAVANTAAAPNVQIDNADDFANTTANGNVTYVAKYPGDLGNSLKISVCDSSAAYSSNLTANIAILSFTLGSNTATVNAYGSAANSGNAAAAALLAAINTGDYIKAGNSTIGYQYLKVTATTGATGAETSSGGNYYANGVTISFDSTYLLASNISMSSNTTQRYWEYYNFVTKAPGQTDFVKALGSTQQDELHVVVADGGGKFTGTPGQILEVFTGLSRANDSVTTSGGSNFYKNVLNLTSKFVYAWTDRSGATSAYGNAVVNSTTTSAYTQTFTGGTIGQGEGSIPLGRVAAGYDLFRSKEDVDVSLVLQGKANDNGGLTNYLIGNLGEGRKDCVVFVSPPSAILSNTDPVQYAVDFRNGISNTAGITINSSYAFMDGNYKYQYDKYNDTYRWVPLNGDMAGLCAATDFNREAWYSPAGFNRGQIKNTTKLLYNPTQAQRDLLYKNDINPVVNFQGQGTILYGDKTLYGKPSAFDRINVRRLFITLEKAISKAAQSSLFEFNDAFTRNQFKNLVEPYLRQVQGLRGIYDFKVVCDETNNTDSVIDSNQFVGDIYIKPAKSINFIQLNFTAVRSGVDFNVITGKF